MKRFFLFNFVLAGSILAVGLFSGSLLADSSLFKDFSQTPEHFESQFKPQPITYRYRYPSYDGWERALGVNLGYLNFWRNFKQGEAYEQWEKPFEAEVRVGLLFEKISHVGRELVGRLRFQSEKFAEHKLFVSGKDFIDLRLGLEVKECDGIKPKVVGTVSGSFEEMISGFHALELQNFFKCNFDVYSVALGDQVREEFYKNGQIKGLDGFDFQLSLTENNDVQLYANGQIFAIAEKLPAVQLHLKRVEGTTDPSGRDRAKAVANAFTGIVRKYGQLLIDTVDLSANERDLAIRKFLYKSFNNDGSPSPGYENNLGKLDELLTELKNNYKALHMTDKMAIMWSINNAFEYVRYFEVKVARLIRSPLESIRARF